MVDSDRKAKIDLINVELVEFDIQTIMFLADNIYKTCHNWAINNFTRYSNNNLIMSLIINIKATSATHIEEFLTIAITK